MFDKVKEYYETGLWGLGRVKNAVAKKVLSPEEYKKITGLEYSAEEDTNE